MSETENERLARITGVPLDVVAAVFAEPVAGLIQTDAELERVHERIERGDQAEQELAYRALMNDHDPTLYAEVPMLDDDRHVMATPRAKLESQRDSYAAALKAAKGADDRELVAVLARALAEVRRKLSAKEFEADDDAEELLYRQMVADLPGAA